MKELTVEQLKRIIRQVLRESEELLAEPDEFEDDFEEQEEASVAGAVAGYTLPLGAKPKGYNRKEFVKSAKSSFGGND